MDKQLIRSLWKQQEYRKILPELPALKSISTFDIKTQNELLNLYAKVWLQVVQTDSAKPAELEMAVTLTLSALENPYLQSTTHSGRSVILELLTRICSATPGHLAFLTRESRALALLQDRQLRSGINQHLLICAPTAAAQLGISRSLFKFLSDTSDEEDLRTLATLEKIADYSDYFGPLKFLHEGEVETAFLALVKFKLNLHDSHTASERILSFAGQLIFFERGIKSFKEGNLRSKKYLSEAMPLMKEYPQFQERLTQVIYQDPDSPMMTTYASLIQDLCKLLPSSCFKKSAAFAISIKARDLFHTNTLTSEAAVRMIGQALQLDPQNETALTFQSEIQGEKLLETASKALGRLQFENVIDLIEEVRSPYVLDQFIEMAEEFKERFPSFVSDSGRSEEWKEAQMDKLNSVCNHLRDHSCTI